MKVKRLLFLILVGSLTVVDAGVLKSIKTEKGKDIYRVVLETDIPVEKFQYKDITGPPRIVIDLFGTVYSVPFKNLDINEGQIIKVRGNQYSVTPRKISRVVIDLEEKMPYTVRQEKNELFIDISMKVSNNQHNTNPDGDPPQGDVYTQDSESEIFFYDSRGKRDPFEQPEIEEEGDTLLNISNAKLVGVVGSPEDRYALVKDSKGRGFVLKKGDKIKNGIVSLVKEDEIIFIVNDYGISRVISLELQRGSTESR